MAYSASKRKATGDSSTSVVEFEFVHQREMSTPKPIKYRIVGNEYDKTIRLEPVSPRLRHSPDSQSSPWRDWF